MSLSRVETTLRIEPRTWFTSYPWTSIPGLDDGRFDWVKVEEERPRLEIRPPRRSDSAAGPGKRRRAVSVPDQGDIRAKEPPARLYNIIEEEMPKD